MLPLVLTLGWLPALIAASWARAAAGPSHVLSAAGDVGTRAASGLAVTLLVLSAAYVSALRRPPSVRITIVACIGSLLGALAMPVLYSADVYAYAYYGDLALHGHNPYAHDPTRRGGALAAAAIVAWDGHIPPRCVYGPVAVAVAAIADLAGAAGGVPGQIAGQRLAAVAAYAAYVALTLRLGLAPRVRTAMLLNPVVLWSVAEGHNDAAMLALVVAGIAAGRSRAALWTLAVLVKAPALLVLGALERRRTACIAVACSAIGYLPLALAVAFDAGAPSPKSFANPAFANPAAWQSPLGLLAALVGRVPAVTLACLGLGALAYAIRRRAPVERRAVLAVTGWFALPNAYPWYALWIVPLAARDLRSPWSQTLLVASIFAAARAATDAIFPAANTFAAARAFHMWMIALEFLPPLCLLAYLALRRQAALGAATVTIALALAFGLRPAEAQTMTPSPTPAVPGSPGVAPPAGPAPLPAPVTPIPGLPTPPIPGLPTPPIPGLPTPPMPQPTPSVTPLPSPSPMPLPIPTPVAPATSPPAPVATTTPSPNPFGYIISPPPVAATTPDGPHIIEVELNDRHIHAGGPLLVRVITSANVVGVEARALGRFIPIPQNSPGLYSLAYTLPSGIPFWLLNKNYEIVIAAATADGRQTSVSFPMLLTR